MSGEIYWIFSADLERVVTSSMVKQLLLPAPPLTPWALVLPGLTIIRFVPRELISDSISAWDPFPKATSAITGAKPIMIPNIVSRLLILFRVMLLRALITNCLNLIIGISISCI
jgi:hypothetical protein